MKRATTSILVACVCTALLVTGAVTPAAAQSNGEQLLVDVDAEGDAVVSMTFVYELGNESEKAAFEELRGNETARTEAAERFENRLSTVASDTAAATDREMSVREANVELRVETNANGDVGIVTLSAEWSNLAAVDGDRLAVTEPFASGFEPDRAFTVAVPDGYAITSTTPEPERTDETSATWSADSRLESFELVAEADGSDETSEASDSGTNEATPEGEDTEDSPGFGVVAPLVALSAGALLAYRRRHR